MHVLWDLSSPAVNKSQKMMVTRRKVSNSKNTKRIRKAKDLRKKLPNPVSSHVPGWMRNPISKTQIIWRICSTGIRYRVTEWVVSDVEKQYRALVFDGTDVRTSGNILALEDKLITTIRNVGSCSASDVTPYPSSTELSMSHHCINIQIAVWSRPRHASESEMDDYKMIVYYA